MAKKAPVRNAPRNSEPQKERGIGVTRALPTGYKKRTNEVVGFWDPKWEEDSGEPPPAIHFIPRSARAFDNKTDELKSSVLIQGDSVGVNTLHTGDGEVFECKDGDVIGVWYKPGMSAIKDLRNVKVYMFPSGFKDTGKPQPMALFEVSSEKTGDAMVIDDDYRKRSVGTKLPFDVKATAGEADETDGPPY